MKVVWATAARADLARILAFNLEKSEHWAARVDGRLRQRAVALSQTPFIGRRIGPALRALSIPDIQYVMIYRVVGEQVTIVRVRSTRENWEA